MILALDLRSLLATRRFAGGVVALATLIGCVSLGSGLVADDLWHEVYLTHPPGFGPMRQPWYLLFSFFVDTAQLRWFVDEGFAPWWTDTGLRVALFRPLSSATHALDYALWPRSPALMHAHSLAWGAALVAVAAWTYRRLIGRSSWAAGLATLLYALDPGHGVPLGWVANRNALVAAVFAIASLGAHDVAARASGEAGDAGARRARAWPFLSAALLALALCGGEVGAAGVALLAAHAAFLDRRTVRTRLAALAPHAVVVVAWAVAYRALGFGVTGSGMYVEPVHAPLAFARAVAKNLPVLVGSSLGGPPPDLFALFEGATRAATAAGALAASGLAWVACAPLVRADPRARFFAAGGVLATLPSCATFPSGRLMLAPGFATLGLVALAAAGLVDRAPWAASRARALRVFVAWACWARLTLAVPMFVATLLGIGSVGRVITRFVRGLPAASDVARPSRVVLVNAPDTVFGAYVVGRTRLADPPARWRMLSLAGGRRTLRIRRADDRTLVVANDGGFYRVGTELLVRPNDAPMEAGARVELTGVAVEVLHATGGVPDEAAFRFDVPLEDASLAWRRWEGDALVPFAPPREGDTVSIAGALPPLF